MKKVIPPHKNMKEYALPGGFARALAGLIPLTVAQQYLAVAAW